MAAFGSFALLIALALAGWNLLAGALALRWLAAGQPAWIRISPERLADTARGRNGRVCGHFCGGFFALVLVGFANDFSIITSWSTRTAPCLRPTSFRAVERQEGSLVLWGGCWGLPVSFYGCHIRQMSSYTPTPAQSWQGFSSFFFGLILRLPRSSPKRRNPRGRNG